MTNTNHGDVDLHLHTCHSDGYYTPNDLIDKVHSHGLSAIAIVDHDEIGALPEAIQYGKSKNIEVLPGVELSVYFRGQDIHVLGYCFDYHDSDLLDYLGLFRRERLKRARQIIEKLALSGIHISLDDVLEKGGAGSIGRPHIANVMLENGVIDSFQEAFDRFLGDGKPANVEKYKIDVYTAVSIVKSAGGICSIAHPGIQVQNRDLMPLFKMGIQGIEVVHPKHREEKTDFYRNLARNHGLLATGGSDFHGGPKGEEALGKYTVEYEIVGQMKALGNCQQPS
ncbi:MAG: PHP domain-containing protein [bacterium]